jgi:putative addiction module killer protein
MYHVKRTEEFKEWLRNLKDMNAFAQITKRLTRVVDGNLGDYKSVGDKIFEMRVNIGPGYRIYFTKKGTEYVFLLLGGDKSTQHKDIVKAKKIAEEYGV